MQVLILYYSKIENIKKLIESISLGVESISGVFVNIKSTSKVLLEDFKKCSALIFETPIYFSSIPYEVIKIFDNFFYKGIMKDKIGTMFITSTDLFSEKNFNIFFIIKFMLMSGIILVDNHTSTLKLHKISLINLLDESFVEDAFNLGKRVSFLLKKINCYN